MAVLGANLFGVFSIGIWKTFNKYVNLKVLGGIITKIRREPTIIIVAPITFFVGLIEIVGEFAKVASLSFRLFGNVFAGEVLLLSMAALVAYVVPIPFIFLELLVGFIQALIFATLLVVYFTIASSDHDEHEAEHKVEHSDADEVESEPVHKDKNEEKKLIKDLIKDMA
jgi:F-type H+-transporting ATPase subunit a